MNYETALVHLPIMNLVRMHEESIPDLITGIIHIPNEGKRTQAQHAFLVAMGMRKGASDLILLRARQGFHGLAMELKAPGKLGTATPEQKEFLRQQAKEGWVACVCDDPELGFALLSWYMGRPGRFQFPQHNGHFTPIAHIRWAHEL